MTAPVMWVVGEFRVLHWCRPMPACISGNKMWHPDDHLIWCPKVDSGPHQIHLGAVMLCMSKTSKILKQAITDFLEFISLLSKMSKIDQIHLKTVMLCMSKMSKIDQIHIRAVILSMSKMLKMGKEHTHTLLLITFLIFN